MIEKEALGALVRKIRRKRKISVAELSEKCGISQTNIYKIERGEVYPGLFTLDAILHELEYKFVIGGTRKW